MCLKSHSYRVAGFTKTKVNKAGLPVKFEFQINNE